MRILMTNDDGIEEVESRLLPVAERLREFAEVVIVVADQDRSGTSNMMSMNARVSMESRLEHVSEASLGRHRLEVHAVIGGYPADCVLLGAYGIMADGPPDLVISGPNGGANLADGWFGSGTIGAARTAAYAGIPAIAVSGLDSDEPDQVAALAEWVAAVARSDVARSIPDQVYLTVGVPTLAPEEIRGIRVADRARMVTGLRADRVAEVEEDDDEVVWVWTAEFQIGGGLPPFTSDVAFYYQGYVVVTPMRVDEHDSSPEVRALLEALPAWPGG